MSRGRRTQLPRLMPGDRQRRGSGYEHGLKRRLAAVERRGYFLAARYLVPVGATLRQHRLLQFEQAFGVSQKLLQHASRNALQAVAQCLAIPVPEKLTRGNVSPTPRRTHSRQLGDEPPEIRREQSLFEPAGKGRRVVGDRERDEGHEPTFFSTH